MKINVDAAVSKNSGIVAAAAVARDSTGSFLGASAVTLEGITNPETVEALACRELQTMGIIKEIKARVVSDFQSVDFVHERRETNFSAHVLARSSLYETLGRHVWYLEPPAGVCNSYNIYV
uniref:Uncharacterized protein n=1 Tax=Setaria italica TaxID=4555 RepID=K4AIW4_SETIT